MKYALIALILTACGLTETLNDIEDTLDPPPKVIQRDHQVPPCVEDSVQAADLVIYTRCEVAPR